MKYFFGTLALFTSLLFLAGCETVSKEQCVAGDWEALGKADAANGHPMSRFEDIVKDCGRHGITPDANLYQQGWNQGVLLYCTPLNGFNVGRQNKGLSPICPPHLAGSFQYSYELGNRIWTAEDRVRQEEMRISRLESEINRTQFDLGRNDCKSLQGDQRDACRDKAHDLRQKIQFARFELQDARWKLRDRERDYELTVAEVNAEAASLIPGYSPR